jgi:predicted membrane protein
MTNQNNSWLKLLVICIGFVLNLAVLWGSNSINPTVRELASFTTGVALLAWIACIAWRVVNAQK